MVDSSYFKGKVLNSILREFDIYKKSPSWLNDNISFNNDLRISKRKSALIEKLFNEIHEGKNLYNKINKLIQCETLVGNLISTKSKPIAVSLNPSNWGKSRYNHSSKFMVSLIKNFHKNKLLNMKIGYRTENEAKLTRIWATPKLREYFQVLPEDVESVAKELVELKDSNGNLINYIDTDKTHKIRDVLKQANNVNTKSDIRDGRYEIKTSLVAIFKEKFYLYGRLHTRGYRHLQGLAKKERSRLTINGDSVIELDFSALHPNLLYAKEGIQFKGDPYNIVDDRREVRPLLKHILLCMLNAEDETKAQQAVNSWLNKSGDKSFYQKLGILKVKDYMDRFIKTHQPIVKYFCKGKRTSMRIMNKDSRIALDVIEHFAKQEVPILAVHDSFIIQHRYKKELKETMKMIYAKHTGGYKIKIKRNK